MTDLPARADTLAALERNPNPSVLVIGGGINGISVFRELALNGVDVLLADKADFCSGASAALSRMVHGGLRYLENGEFKLVRESLLERDRLLKNAPHFVAPLPTTVPIFGRFSGLANSASRFLGLTRRPGRRGALVVKLGLSLYDFFTGGRRVLPRHEFRSRRETLARWPALNGAVSASATYFDAWVSRPERLGLEMLREASSGTALALNYAQVARTEQGLALHDMTGGGSVPIAPRIIVNATGGWIDLTNAGLGQAAPALIGGTKGSHLVIENEALLQALDGHMIYYENEDGRICIAFPYLGKVLVGSTDIRVTEPDTVRCEAEEQDYILNSLSLVFPGIHIAPREIVFRFSGVRPLPLSTDKVTGRIPRDHFCETIEGQLPVICMIGGKWTTFRSFGALAADMAMARLGKSRIRGTETMPIGGGLDFPAEPDAWAGRVAALSGLAASRVETLLARYGTMAEPLAKLLGAEPETFLAGTSYSHSEILHLIRTEAVETLSDVVLRRTDLAITGAISLGAIEEILDLLAKERAWPPERRASALSAFLEELAFRHGLDAETLSSRDRTRNVPWPQAKSA